MSTYFSREQRAAIQISEDQCVSNGGHCFQRDWIVLASYPPQYPEQCKHCGKRRIATPREPFTYRDEP